MSQDCVWSDAKGSRVDRTVRRAEQIVVGVTRRLGGRQIRRGEFKLWS